MLQRRRKLPTWGGFKRMLVHGDDFHETNTRGGEPYFSGPVPGSATAQSEKMVIGGYGPQYVQSSPSSQAESASTPFSTSSQQVGLHTSDVVQVCGQYCSRRASKNPASVIAIAPTFSWLANIQAWV